MRAVLPHRPNASGVHLGTVPEPEPGDGDVLIDIAATALNRADLLQMRGLYPPPAGASDVPGLECAGTVAHVGHGVNGVRAGDRVMALLAGGGHAERVAVPAGQTMPLPEGWSFTDAAALPEVAITAWTNLVAEGGLQAGERVMITAAASGVGTFAVQLARSLGAEVLVAGRNRERLERLKPLGADHCVVLDERLPSAVRACTGGAGVDLVVDLAGGPWLPLALKSLRPKGRLVLVGVLAGASADVDLGDLLRRRLRVIGSVLRARPASEKAALVRAFHDFAAPRLQRGDLRPIVDRVVPFDDIAAAYEQLKRGGVWGKLVVDVNGAKRA